MYEGNGCEVVGPNDVLEGLHIFLVGIDTELNDVSVVVEGRSRHEKPVPCKSRCRTIALSKLGSLATSRNLRAGFRFDHGLVRGTAL